MSAPVVVTIRDRRTGVERIYRDIWPYDEEGLEFMWSEGNYGCDCNRAIFFARAGGESPPDHVGCSDENFAVRVEWNGRVVYDEFQAGSGE